MDPIEFRATIPPLQSAVTIDGDGQAGTRIKLDLAGDDLPPVLHLLMSRGEVLRVRVESE